MAIVAGGGHEFNRDRATHPSAHINSAAYREPPSFSEKEMKDNIKTLEAQAKATPNLNLFELVRTTARVEDLGAEQQAHCIKCGCGLETTNESFPGDGLRNYMGARANARRRW